MAASDHCWAQEIFQTSTMGALLDGAYEGNVTVRELLRHGDFGLGTFNRLDGEMLVLDGVCYQLRGDGSAALADLDELTPFAAVTWFHPDGTIDVSAPHDRGALKARKMGCKVQDTAELSFADVRVPTENVLGEVDEAFAYLSMNLPQERLTIAVGAVAQSRSAIAAAIEYTQSRKVFGTTVSSFQNTKFELAACSTDVEAAQTMVDRATALHVEDALTPDDAARVKLFCTEMQQRVVDRCLQLFGGYGYMMEYPIARLYNDARVTRIYAGTSEVMKVIIAKSLGL